MIFYFSHSLKFQNSSLQSPSYSPTTQHPQTPLTTSNYPLSPAEQYVLFRSEGFTTSHINISSETPSAPPFLSHAQLMQRWQQEKTNEINRKQKHRYSYNTAPPSSSNLPLQQSSSIDSNKNDNLTNRSQSTNSEEKLKIISAV